MLDHLSHALHTFPVFGLVGLQDRPVRPVAVEDVVQVLTAAALGDPRLAGRTVAVLGPDELPLGDAVRRVALAVGRSPRYVRLPTAAQLILAHAAELVMRVPLVSIAQVHILAEGVTVPAPSAETLPPDLQPRTPFSVDVIRRGLPAPGGFGRRDLRSCREQPGAGPLLPG
jgi:NADH dehydrogenase